MTIRESGLQSPRLSELSTPVCTTRQFGASDTTVIHIFQGSK
jgi:hypothetical protein